MSMRVAFSDTGSVELENIQTVPGVLRLEAATTVKAATLLARGDDEDFVLWDPAQSRPAIAVLPYERQAGPGALPIDAIIQGKVDRNRLVIHGSPNPITETVADQLRTSGIVPLAVQQLAKLEGDTQIG